LPPGIGSIAIGGGSVSVNGPVEMGGKTPGSGAWPGNPTNGGPGSGAPYARGWSVGEVPAATDGGAAGANNMPSSMDDPVLSVDLPRMFSIMGVSSSGVQPLSWVIPLSWYRAQPFKPVLDTVFLAFCGVVGLFMLWRETRRY
jgi:hypothetical protein